MPPEPCLWRRQQEFVAWSAFVSFLLEQFASRGERWSLGDRDDRCCCCRRIRWCGRRRRRRGSATGCSPSMVLKDQRFRGVVHLNGAESPRAGARGARRAATSVSRATRDQSDLRSDRCSSRLGGAAAAGRTMVRSTAAPSRLVNLVGGDDGARAFGANADGDVAAAAAGRAARYGSSPTARSQPH